MVDRRRSGVDVVSGRVMSLTSTKEEEKMWDYRITQAHVDGGGRALAATLAPGKAVLLIHIMRGVGP